MKTSNANVLAEQIIGALRSVIGEGSVALHEPSFSGNELAYLKECIDSTFVSSVGKFVDQFEFDLAKYTGVCRAVAVVNGTAALHICLKLVGVEPNDEVIVPTLTFVATPNAVSYCGAIPHFVDSEESTLGLDVSRLEDYLADIGEHRKEGFFNKLTGRRIKAVVPMHTFGHPVELDSLLEVCNRYQLELVEDAAESLGSFYKGRHTGGWGKVAALSFNGNKIMTTGGGGAILTNDLELARLAKHLTTTAKAPHKWEFSHDMVGYNYRMPNINAALGCAQLEMLPTLLKDKRALAERYREVFCKVEGVSFFAEPKNAKSNYWLNALLLDSANADQRDTLLELTNREGIMTRPVWTLMHKLEIYSRCPRMGRLDVAEGLERRLLNIPSSAGLRNPIILDKGN